MPNHPRVKQRRGSFVLRRPDVGQDSLEISAQDFFYDRAFVAAFQQRIGHKFEFPFGIQVRDISRPVLAWRSDPLSFPFFGPPFQFGKFLFADVQKGNVRPDPDMIFAANFNSVVEMLEKSLSIGRFGGSVRNGSM